MAISVTCPGCRTSYPVTEDLLGKKIRCKKCQETFTATASKATAAAGRAADERIQTRPSARAAEDGNGAAPANGRTKPAAAPPRAIAGNKAAVMISAGAGALVVTMGIVTFWALNRTPDTPPDSGLSQVVPTPPPRITPRATEDTKVGPAAIADAGKAGADA